MRYAEMMAKLRRTDITGVGVATLDFKGRVNFYWYEDFVGSKGIDRAERCFSKMIENGKIRRADYFYQQHRTEG